MLCKLLWTLYALHAWADAKHDVPEARMPNRFSVKFDELIYTHNASAPNGIARLMGNASGSWTYDAATYNWIYEHGPDGSFSMFCGVNDQKRQRCWLHFHAGDDLKVLYQNGTCCSLCGASEGCSFLRPDWLTFGNYTPIPQPPVVIDGATCKGWGRPGAVTSVDAWFATDDGTPCMYFEHFLFGSGELYHNVTFRRDTYSTAAMSDEMWRLPPSCSTICPKHGYPPHFETLLHITQPTVYPVVV